jgi:hypothetical protein
VQPATVEPAGFTRPTGLSVLRGCFGAALFIHRRRRFSPGKARRQYKIEHSRLQEQEIPSCEP